MQLANRTKNFCFVSISLAVCNINCSEKEKNKRKIKQKTSFTYNSVTSLGIALGKTFKPLLLHRTTVSKQVHSVGQRESGEQLLSSFPKRPKQTQENPGLWL